jgi:hypothetical protein
VRINAVTMATMLLALASTPLPGQAVDPAPPPLLWAFWELDHQLGPQPWMLTLVQTVQQQTSQTQATLTMQEATVCQQKDPSHYVADRTWCATLPCPAPGAYKATIQANDVSEPANPMASFGVKDATCTLISYAEALDLPATPAPTTPAPNPNPDPAPTPAPDPPPGGQNPPPLAPPSDPLTPAQQAWHDLWDAFEKLEAEHHAAQEALRKEYQDALDELLQHPSHRAKRRLTRMYAKMAARQQRAYAEALDRWDVLYHQWRDLMTGDTTTTTTTEAPATATTTTP